MLSKKTIIGIIVGSIIIALGAVSLIVHVGTLTINENYLVEYGDQISYTIPAPANTPQSMKIIGDSFNLNLKSPGNGLQILNKSYTEELKLDWVHSEEGETKIQIRNTGNTELEITGVLIRSSDPIWFTYDLMVIITGVVIIGFSMGLTFRKPKGF
ncbi:MAG: hypothetical protein OEL77_04735 [Nitrosopumilus sp.]|nr:hypothetical protein [Nitrosopumilus sp.]MDH3385303.1 hypothetical protein [Nitrosopumilus sp.]